MIININCLGKVNNAIEWCSTDKILFYIDNDINEINENINPILNSNCDYKLYKCHYFISEPKNNPDVHVIDNDNVASCRNK